MYNTILSLICRIMKRLPFNSLRRGSLSVIVFHFALRPIRIGICGPKITVSCIAYFLRAY